MTLISSTQLAIKLHIGAGKEPENCDEFIEKPQFLKFMKEFGPKIKNIHINYFVVNFVKFFNNNAATLENLLKLGELIVNDKVS